MLVSNKILQEIKDLVDIKYNELLQKLTTTKSNSSPEILLLEIIHNYVQSNNPLDTTTPKTLKQAIEQQKKLKIKKTPSREAILFNAQASFNAKLENLKNNFLSKILNSIISANEIYNIPQPEEPENKLKSKTIKQLTKEFREISKESNRDWRRIVVTEMSNLIGISSTNRILEENTDKDPEDIYVYRIIVDDAATCEYCRKFYTKSGAPKLYKLSTLIANGTNYGKAKPNWLPVVGATHPNTRTSQIVELKPGFAAEPGGGQKFIGLDKWDKYIKENLAH